MSIYVRASSRKVIDLRKVHAKGIDFQTVEEACKALIESGQALVHQLQMHEIGFQVCHAICKLRECWLEGVQKVHIVPASCGCLRRAKRAA